jgi:hypothetical protein
MENYIEFYNKKSGSLQYCIIPEGDGVFLYKWRKETKGVYEYRYMRMKDPSFTLDELNTVFRTMRESFVK